MLYVYAGSSLVYQRQSLIKEDPRLTVADR